VLYKGVGFIEGDLSCRGELGLRSQPVTCVNFLHRLQAVRPGFVKHHVDVGHNGLWFVSAPFSTLCIRNRKLSLNLFQSLAQQLRGTVLLDIS
jgi:hypothetical protein